MHKAKCDIPSKKVIVHVFIATFDGRKDSIFAIRRVVDSDERHGA